MKYNSIRKFKKRFKSVCSGVSDFHLLVNMSDFGDTNKFKTDLIKKNMIDTHHIINGYNLYITKLAMLEFYIIGYYLKKFNEDYVFNILTGLKESDLNYNYFSNLKSKLYSNIVNINFDSNIVEYYKGNELWYEITGKKYVILSLLGTPVNRNNSCDEINDINSLINDVIDYSKDTPKHTIIIDHFKQFIEGEL
jgi:hypothetical protein